MKFIFRAMQQALTNILRNKTVNFLCLGIIAFTLLVPGIFAFISFHLDRYVNRLNENVEAIFYIRDGNDDAGNASLGRRIEESLLVKEARFVSRHQARAEFAREFPELEYILAEFEDSPFPAAFHVKFRADGRRIAQIESFIRDIERDGRVESVQLNLDWARKISMVKKFVSFAGLFLSIILLFVSVFIIFNVVKINIFYRKDEINILQLVGATDWYIRAPFLLEGSLLGSLGGLLAGVLLLVAVRAFPVYAGLLHQIVKQLIDFRQLPPRIFWQLVATGAVIGLLSAFISLRRFIKHTAA